MKNVKVILISVALCATVFANARIEALGGDAGFWPGDRANVELYPGALNDGNWVEFGGVEGMNPTASVNYGEDVKWGFNFGGVDNNDWVNMSWAKDGMGLSVAMLSSYDSDTDTDVSGFDVAWGQTMSFGELGVSYSTTDNGVTADPITDLTVNWRNACDAWIFDNAKAALSMTDDGAGTTATVLTYDLFTHIKPADGVTALLGMGFAHAGIDANGVDVTQMWLPDALLAVEASMTDWATVRAHVKQTHVFSNDVDGADGDTGNLDWTLANGTNYGFGVGFGWTASNGSSVALDMVVSNTLFTDPIGTMTGFNSANMNNGEVTISYEF